MPTHDSDLSDLTKALAGRGWMPSARELPSLFARLAAGSREEAELCERALGRLGRKAAEEAMARFSASRPPERGRLCRLVGRVAGPDDGELERWLLGALADEDPKTRRNAAIALGKRRGPEIEAALLRRWPDEPLENRRSLAAGLGKLGGPDALEHLRRVETDDPELGRIVGEAVLKLERTLGRAEPGGPGAIDPERAPEKPLPVLLHCRYGLAEILAEELARFSPRVLDEETVEARLSGPLGALFSARTFLRFGFPLPVRVAGSHGLPAAGEAVVAALSSAEALAVVRAFTVGPARYRIEWASGGHRRGLTFRVARELAQQRPELANDPTSSLWEAVVTEPEGGPIAVELWPRGLADPRFAYRRAHLPASSHPTLAAALARLAGARPDDVVWDPFVGAATELIERARLGPYRRLYGTDLDEAVLDRARENLAAAGVGGVELRVADARTFTPPEPPTLILTNPPMGRRVLDRTRTGELYRRFLAHAAQRLAPGGRLVWISPRGDETTQAARAGGLEVTFRRRVDMGGFWAELQRFVRRPAG